MNIFKRLFRIGQAEIHAAVERMEDPVRMTEQGLRELRDDLANATEAYAKIKALALRTRNEQEQCIKQSDAYGEKAVLILQKAQHRELEAGKAEQLAREALSLKRQYAEDALDLEQQAVMHEHTVEEMQKNIRVLQENLAKWEKELKTLRARVKVSAATQQVNKQIAQIDSDSTIVMLERMKEKADDQEALARAYGEIAHEKQDSKSEIDRILKDDSLSVDKELAALKQKLGM
ncbi:MAG: phage shock protein A [Bacteroidetes bacterium 47-18]|nr:MAG: phage shock protein A [Bacteroidetes bacterium 47-18]